MTTLTAPEPKTESTSNGTVGGTAQQQVTEGKRLVFDLEANGLWDADTIWCVATKDLDTGEEKFYGPDDSEAAKDSLIHASLLVGHNIIEFDIPLLERVYGLKGIMEKAYDTLVVSRLLNPDRLSPPGVKTGPHALGTWGYRLGRGKPEHEDWSQFSDEMKHRCQEDVRINELVYYALSEEMGDNDWSEAIAIEMRVADIIATQARNGVYLDVPHVERCINDLDNKIETIDAELRPMLPVEVKTFGVTITAPFLKSGAYRKTVREWYEDDILLEQRGIGGPFTRIYFEEFNLNSKVKLKELLLSLGWKPITWNFKNGERSSPKLEFADDDSDGLDEGLGKLIKDFNMWSHRRSQMKGWLRNVRDDQTIPAGANPCGTNTRRMRHRLVVNVPKAEEYVPYGHEMRSCFTHRPGRILLGYDGKGLELRLLAHYMNDPRYIEEILNGDIHVYNQTLAGLATRDNAKTFIYALNYGASDAKLGDISGGSAKDGAELRKRFLASCPSLDKLLRGVKRASGRGWLRTFDGGLLYIRRGSDGRLQRNKALNTLLQGGASVVMKKAMVLMDDAIKAEGLDVLKVLDMHDESQLDVALKDVDRVKELCEQCMIKAGEHFNLNIPLAADVKIGETWAETH